MRPTNIALAALLSAAALSANTYTVTSTADAGAGTLRQAILDANAHAGADTIAFNITGSGVHTIAPTADLPAITDAVTIDGYTQAGSSPNTQPTSQGLNTVLQILLDGSGAPGGTPCLVASASDVTIRGLVVHRCIGGGAISLEGANGVVAGNFLGTMPDGATLPPNEQVASGVLISGNGARVGGTAPADRNLISGFNFSAVQFGGGSNGVVQGNLIAMKASGAEPLPDPGSSSAGVTANAGSGIVIGGASAAARNVFGNPVHGVLLGGTAAATVQGNYFGVDVSGQRVTFQGQFVNHGNDAIQLLSDGAVDILDNTIGGVYAGVIVSSGAPVIQGNFIGTDSTGTLDLGCQFRGVYITGGSGAIVGGTAAGEGNVIAFNGHTASPAAGVSVDGGDPTIATIRGNSIFSNRGPLLFSQTPPTDGLGIDIDPQSFGGTTPNDVGDGDSGPNGKQNFPLITSAVLAAPEGNGTRVQGTLNSQASTSYDVDFYRSCSVRPQELPEGADYMGSTVATTDSSGNATFDVTLADNIGPADRVTATATDPSGRTSEFSQELVFSADKLSGPAAGGTAMTFKGMLFENGATLTIGGVPAASVVVQNETTITANMPALPAGSVNDAVVTNPSGSHGTLQNAWVADFLDVPPSQQFYGGVIRLVRGEITAGVGGGNYGVTGSTLRQQMAVFLLKGKHGVCYTPPPCTGVFPDVPCPSTFANWIEALAAEGITGGCGGGNYCPGALVLRQQMAVFLLKAKHGSAYLPPACSGDFPDVPCPSPFADWIEQLAAEGITGGCGGSNYCPQQAVRRDQMAAFLYNTFQLP
jgi:hypothetical protein